MHDFTCPKYAWFYMSEIRMILHARNTHVFTCPICECYSQVKKTMVFFMTANDVEHLVDQWRFQSFSFYFIIERTRGLAHKYLRGFWFSLAGWMSLCATVGGHIPTCSS
jgi:hypothetical protein